MNSGIALLFAAGPLIVVPLLLRVLPTLHTPTADRAIRRASRVALPAGVLLASSFLLSPGAVRGIAGRPVAGPRNPDGVGCRRRGGGRASRRHHLAARAWSRAARRAGLPPGRRSERRCRSPRCPGLRLLADDRPAHGGPFHVRRVRAPRRRGHDVRADPASLARGRARWDRDRRPGHRRGLLRHPRRELARGVARRRRRARGRRRPRSRGGTRANTLVESS